MRVGFFERVGAGSSVLDRGQVPQRGMSALVVVLVLPVADHDPCMEQRVEAVDVQTLVAEPRVERLNVSVSPGLTGRDVRQPGSRASPVCNGIRDELRPVVTSQHHRCPMLSDEFLEMLDESLCGDRPLHKTTQTHAGVLIHEGADLDRFAALIDIKLEINRPHHARRSRLGGVSS